jgi:PAS domain S-box-containing protein
VERVAELERCVAERTAELEVALNNLQAQSSQRAQAEARLRDSETRYRHLVERSPEAVLVVKPGRVLYANPACVKLFGARDTAELLATRPLSLVHPNEQTRAAEHLTQLAGTNDIAPDIEARFVRFDGGTIEAEITSAGVNFDGQPAAQLLIRDVGERRAVERLKDELLSIVSHELRTPLTGLRGSLGLLAGGLLADAPDRGQRMLEIAVTNTDRLIRLLNDVLDLERMRAGRLSPRLTDLAAVELIDVAVAESFGLAECAGVRLRVGAVEGRVSADADRLVQVLTNLLSNAIKFSPRGSEVSIEARERGPLVRFSVTDQGRGIPADLLETIFERFRQVDSSDARVKGGTGLGLAISRAIVQQHSGRLWAESTFGRGSTFYVELGAVAT